jgi:hypothetical protein
MLPISSTLIMMVITDKILEVSLGATIGVTEIMTRNEVREIGRQTVGRRLEWSFTMIKIQLVNDARHEVFTTCILTTISTRKGKQGRRLDKNSRGVALLGQGWNRRGGQFDKSSRGGGRENLIFFNTSAGNILAMRTISLLVGLGHWLVDSLRLSYIGERNATLFMHGLPVVIAWRWQYNWGVIGGTLRSTVCSTEV